MNGEGSPSADVRRAVKAAIAAGVPFDDDPCSADAQSDDGMLLKLRWLRDTVGVDIERMFARAQKEKDGRGAAEVPPAGVDFDVQCEATYRGLRCVFGDRHTCDYHYSNGVRWSVGPRRESARPEPYRPCVDHGAYDPALSQCPNCLAVGAVARAVPNACAEPSPCSCDEPTCFWCMRQPAPTPIACAAEPAPIPMFLTCPKCNARHIDEGDFATKRHHTHSCQACGLTWRPAVGPTVGVAFLPGFKNEAPPAVAPSSCVTGEKKDGAP